ncbi:MAG: hypothetical protein ACYSO7_06585 [Planctomycetota bacterium]|jgi:hypothetical protein
MKKVLILLAVLAMTGIASAALVNNPETFDTLTAGIQLGQLGTVGFRFRLRWLGRWLGYQ